MDWVIRTHGSVRNLIWLLVFIQLTGMVPVITAIAMGAKLTYFMLPPVLLPLIVTVGLLVQLTGMPYNWWQVFCGHIVEARSDVFEYHITMPYVVFDQEVTNWFREVIPNDRSYQILTNGRVQFRRKSDAILFKLAWG
jgi:hypothetical protein